MAMNEWGVVEDPAQKGFTVSAIFVFMGRYGRELYINNCIFSLNGFGTQFVHWGVLEFNWSRELIHPLHVPRLPARFLADWHLGAKDVPSISTIQFLENTLGGGAAYITQAHTQKNRWLIWSNAELCQTVLKHTEILEQGSPDLFYGQYMLQKWKDTDEFLTWLNIPCF